MTTNRMFVLLLCMLTLLVSACSVKPAFVNQRVQFNEDLSGTYTALLAFTNYDYSLMYDHYGNDPANEIAAEWAETWKMDVYQYDHYSSNGYQWVRVDAPFDNEIEYKSFIDFYDVKLDEEQYPDFYNSASDTLFRTRYVHEGTWLSAESMNNSNVTNEWSTIPWVYSAQLPGEIVSTDGTVGEDGETVNWDLAYYKHTSYRLVTEVRRITSLQVQHIIQVEEDLSGHYKLALGFRPNEYQKLANHYSTARPEGAIAAEIAERFGWGDYEYGMTSEAGTIWITVHFPFADANNLHTLYQVMAADAGSNAQLAVEREGNEYHFSAIPLQLFIQEFNTSLNAVRATIEVKMPGEIIETNGEEVAEGAVQWDGSAEELSLTTRYNSTALDALMVLGTAMLGMTVLSRFAILRRRRSSPATSDTPDSSKVDEVEVEAS